MALGFVVERFSFVLQQISVVLWQARGGASNPALQAEVATFDVVPVGLGVALSVLSYVRYRTVGR
jgi:uncharacterized membrane protein YidH (DUF202 family)